MNQALEKHLKSALYYMQLERYQSAVKEFENALRLSPNDQMVLSLMLICKSNLGVDDSVLQDLALSLLEQDANNGIAHYTLGRVYTKNSQYQKARNHFESAVAIESENIDYLIGFSQLYQQMGKLGKAQELAAMALKKDPKNIKAIVYQGTLENGSADSLIDEKHLRSALRIDPANWFLHAASGDTALAEMNYLKAQKHYGEALRVAPELEETKENYLNSYLARFWLFRWIFSRSVLLHSTFFILRPSYLILFAFFLIFFWRGRIPGEVSFTFWLVPVAYLFFICILYWFAAPFARLWFSYKFWGTFYAPLLTYKNFVFLNGQLAVLSLLYFAITDEFVGVTTAMFLVIYGMLSSLIVLYDNIWKKKIWTGVFILIYLSGMVNLILSEMDRKFKPTEFLAIFGWVIILISYPIVNWVFLVIRKRNNLKT